MDEADELADRICIMDHGKIIALDTSENLKKQISGDIIDIEFELIEDQTKIPDIINKLKELSGIKNISLGNSKKNEEEIPMNFKLPQNVDPEKMKARIKETMSDPKKLIAAWKKYPLASQMFMSAPLDTKIKIANLFTDKLIEQIPEDIKQEIIKIKKGEYQSNGNNSMSIISISCENGGKALPLIIHKINDNNLPIKSVNMHQPKLEDVFLHFVGNAIREESSDMMKGIKSMIQMKQLRQTRK